jgi:hypothetical protein
MNIESRLRELDLTVEDAAEIARWLEGRATSRSQREAIAELRAARDDGALANAMFHVRQAFLSKADGWVAGATDDNAGEAGDDR